jgi:uncharacterized protein (TIGR00245 family)
MARQSLLKKQPKKETVGRSHKVLVVATVLFLLMAAHLVPAPSYAASPSSSSATLPAALGWRQLLSAATLLTVTGGIGLSLQGLPIVAQSLLAAAGRCTLQLYLIGGFVLTNILITSTTKSWMVIGWIIFTAFVAAREAGARVVYSYPQLYSHFVLSLLTSGFVTLGVTLAFGLLGRLNPWFSPRTLIPVAGMLMGNSLTAISLVAAGLTRDLATTQGLQVEERLARGATWREALSPVLHSTLTTALTPTINALSVTGLVHIPGMMTGQILAGQDPYQAAAYQILILFLIASMTATASQVFLHLAVGNIVDKSCHRLRLGMLTKASSSGTPSSLGSWIKSSLTSWWYMKLPLVCKRRESSFDENAAMLVDGASSQPMRRIVELDSSASDINETQQPVLSLREMKVERTNTQVTLDLYPGGRIAILGRSGAGKSQILRTIAGLEEQPVDSSLSLNGSTGIAMPTWRSRVSLVSQDRTTMDGTPGEFFLKTLQYRSQQDRLAGSSYADNDDINPQDQHDNPVEIAREWDLSERVFDQPWSTLSGGEAQRASLAIALALRPEVLLLDESTSALDEQTTLKVETTLKKLGLPLLMVSHSRDQVNRFCNNVLILEDSSAGRAEEGFMNRF